MTTTTPPTQRILAAADLLQQAHDAATDRAGPAGDLLLRAARCVSQAAGPVRGQHPSPAGTGPADGPGDTVADLADPAVLAGQAWQLLATLPDHVHDDDQVWWAMLVTSDALASLRCGRAGETR